MAIWPSATHFHLGRLMVDGVCVEDLADCDGTPTRLGGVVVTRVRSVLAGTVGVDAAACDCVAAEVANRHSVAGREFFAFGDGKVALPSDVRAGDLLALIPNSEPPVPFHTQRDAVRSAGRDLT